MFNQSLIPASILLSFLFILLPIRPKTSSRDVRQRAKTYNSTTVRRTKFRGLGPRILVNLLPSPPLSERRGYCGALRPSVCVSAEPRLHAALVSAAKVMRCIQCSLVYYYSLLRVSWRTWAGKHTDDHSTAQWDSESCLTFYTPRVKKVHSFCHNFTKYWPIFKIFFTVLVLERIRCFAPASLFFVAEKIVNSVVMYCFGLARVNTFSSLSLNHMKLTSFSNCFEQLKLAWRIASISFSATRWKKPVRR